MTVTTPPAFITFTGADDARLCKGMRKLSEFYPIEWGILIDRDKLGRKLFPSYEHIERFRHLGLRLCAHVCGALAREIATGANPRVDLGGFSRIQVNHGRSGADESTIANVGRFAASSGIRGVLQCGGREFPRHATHVDWLFDVSFGEGIRPAFLPPVRFDHPMCGISGGIGPANVREIIESRIEVTSGLAYWIDMESGVRTNDEFDIQLCEAVCRKVYG